MSRPRRSAQTRENLLEQGIALISEHGYHGTGLKMILDAVKVPKGSFYNYFESKEQFAAEIIAAYTEQLFKQFDAYLAESDDPPLLKIRHVYEFMINEFEQQGCTKGCLVGDMAAEVAGSSVLCRAEMQNTLSRWKQRIERLLNEAVDRGDVRRDISVSELADVFWNTWEGGILRMKIDGHAGSLRASLAVLLDTLFKPA
ncbi:MAG: TetR family transcriptional regulator C-terminal domain-containing protein [Oleiphilaceae bacterium]|nr:TetR family transcriptional regulator C-terminal domain-containing protein [Oleiphilaceae bacterium]